ncbi:hypothetical protein PIB30_035455 [Stylosanthes scabra]|uniref:Uncharacterized protein n=1 Tax=Stylosanthes scabra TaxID=79078 RepID=A0ABU6UDB3_9FABA|nr:hypothetical protein [Stylosanthes scabra]
MGFGVCPSQISKSGGTSSSSSLEIAHVHEELAENKATISLLQAQLAYFVKHYMGGQLPDDFPTANHMAAGSEAPMQTRPSSSASHEPQQNQPSNT